MDWNRILGVALIGYGIFTLVTRFREPVPPYFLSASAFFAAAAASARAVHGGVMSFVRA